jgi:hypothetical protein
MCVPAVPKESADKAPGGSAEIIRQRCPQHDDAKDTTHACCQSPERGFIILKKRIKKPVGIALHPLLTQVCDCQQDEPDKNLKNRMPTEEVYDAGFSHSISLPRLPEAVPKNRCTTVSVSPGLLERFRAIAADGWTAWTLLVKTLASVVLAQVCGANL